MKCAICGEESGNKRHPAREMMFGTRDPFNYLECSGCGCLQLLERDLEWSRYYPPEYLPHRGAASMKRLNPLSRWAQARRAEYGLTGQGVLGRLLASLNPLSAFYAQLALCGLRLDSRILDVGSGAGEWLFTLKDEGFKDLLGIDPFLPQDFLDGRPGVRILKAGLDELPPGEPFDFIMLHHSFEHLPDPLRILGRVGELLREGGSVWIRMPVVGYGWEEYGTHWVQLDPPRHLFIHSLASMEILCRQAGFEIADMRHDSTGFLFWGSEQYKRGIPLMDERSHLLNPAKSVFTPQEIADFEKRARDLNKRGNGDQASFCLRKRS